MRKGIILGAYTALLVFACGIAAQCEANLTYSDDYIAFDFESDFNCSITCTEYDDEHESPRGVVASHYVDTKMYEYDESSAYVIIQMIDTEKAKELGFYNNGDFVSYFNESAETGDYRTEPSTENELVSTSKTDTEDVMKVKLLYSNDNFAIIASCHMYPRQDEKNEFVERIYESVRLADNFSGEKYEPAEFEYNYVYCNPVVSDQTINYVNEAIRICGDYLSFDIDADEAKEELAKLQERIANFVSDAGTGYVYDREILNILQYTEYDFSFSDDAGIMDTISELKTVYNIE